ncbi:MAG: efflux RND transporter permease subunit [Magnetococcales bacterium]|nr:efflux RND transporter permease subunit [Magnetococcales bacterium]
MNLVRISAERPVAVAVGVLLVILFGVLALFRIPVQLIPDVRKPTISVSTTWSGASPTEVEGEITIPQEEVLKAVPGLQSLKSSSYFGRSKIKLEFRNGTDMDAALVLVANRLQRVRNYPEDAQRPTLKTADSDDAPITWIRLDRLDPGDMRDMATAFDFAEDVIKPELERIPGVATINIYGGRERELRITVDPARLAARKMTVTDLAEVLRGANSDISAGKLDEGKRSYLVRTVGRFLTPEQVSQVVIRSDEAGPVTVGDVATVAFDYKDASVHVRGNGRSMLAINAIREQGANVLDIMAEVKEALTYLNEGVLQDRGMRLTIVFDQTDYIVDAIDLVKKNLLIGGVLAMGVLILFLRSVSATGIIALAIPISVIGAFLAMAGVGRSVNVISLAGLAFAVGMVVDPAIVVLENIVRLRRAGMAGREAAVKGTSQVWGAIFISTATTVAVFLPILTLKIEAAQLFGDIAVALCAAVLFSLVVSTTVIPTLGSRLIGRLSQRRGRGNGSDNRSSGNGSHIDSVEGSGENPVITNGDGGRGAVGRQDGATNGGREGAKGVGVAGALAGGIRWVNRRIFTRLLVAGVLIAATITTTIHLVPSAEYLPSGNRNLIFAMLIPPPGYNLAEMTRLAHGVEETLKPHWEAAEGEPLREPAIRHFFFVARGAVAFMGAAAKDPERVRDLVDLMKKPIGNIPGTIGIVNQRSIFGRGIGQGRSLDLAITGPELPTVMDLAGRLFGMAQEALPGSQIRPIPGLELANPEIQLIPNRLRSRENGLSAREVGQSVAAFAGDGLRVDEILIEGKEMDLVIRGVVPKVRRTQEVGQFPLVTRNGEIIPVATVADLVMASGPVQIDHLERERSVSLRINPPRETTMEETIQAVREKLIAPMEAEGLPRLTQLRLTEGADQLNLAKEAMKGQFLLALTITFLLMAALFESFLYPLVIIATVPLAAAGGVLGLEVLNLFHHQPLDVLTMLGFVILIGVVVNNAILIVHQALNFIREEGMDPNEAVAESVRIRVRPIFMSTFTSVCGLLPLVLFPGAGSELYRGLGSVVIGGLLLATFLTLALIPTLFSLVMGLRKRILGRSVS